MNNKVKICFIVLGTMYSGAEIVMNRFLNENENIDPYIILIYKNDKVEKIFEQLYGRDKVFSLDCKFSQKNITFLPDLERLKISGKYKTLVNSIRPNIIYINNTTETMLTGGIIKNIPSICHIHDMKSLSRSPIRIAATIRGIKKCKKAVTVSKACKSDWKLDMEVIYNGLNKKIFNYKRTKSIRNIGFIGTPIKRKGIDIILDSMDSILSSYNDITFNFAFNNELSDELKINMGRLCKKYKDRIKIFNELQPEEVIKFYDQMDLIIVSSRHDPLPTVIMESEARGTLVIGSNIDGIPELLNNNKELIIDVINSEELSNKIKYILGLDIDYINDITKNLFEYAETRFEESAKDRAINKIFNSILES